MTKEKPKKEIFITKFGLLSCEKLAKYRHDLWTYHRAYKGYSMYKNDQFEDYFIVLNDTTKPWCVEKKFARKFIDISIQRKKYKEELEAKKNVVI